MTILAYGPLGLPSRRAVRFLIRFIVPPHTAHVDHPQAPAGLGGILDGVLQILSRVDCPLGRGVLLTCRIVPDGEHCEASWEKQIPFFLETLFYGLEL